MVWGMECKFYGLTMDEIRFGAMISMINWESTRFDN
jgi:hypothetical protein